MRRVESVDIQIPSRPAGAANARHGGYLRQVDLAVLKRIHQGRQHRPQPAPSAPDVGDPSLPKQGVHRMALLGLMRLSLME